MKTLRLLFALLPLLLRAQEVIQVDTVADLVALNPNLAGRLDGNGVLQAAVQVKRYSTNVPVGVGAGTYVWAPSYSGTTNALGGALAVTGGAWVDVTQGPRDATRFGAIADGTTDNTAAIAAALSFGGDVRLPGYGTATQYYVAGTAEFTQSNTSLSGDQGIPIIAPLVSQFDTVFYATNKTGLVLRNLIVSAPDNTNDVYALRADLTSDVLIQNCRFTNTGAIITRGFTNQALPMAYADYISAVEGYDTSKQRNFRVKDCVFYGQYDTLHGDFQASAARIDYAEDIMFSGNSINNMYFGLYGIGGRRLWVDTNGVANADYAADRTLERGPLVNKRISFVNNISKGGQAPMWYPWADGVTFAGNVIEGCSDVAYDVELSRNTTISGNTIKNAQTGVYIGDQCDGITITGNSFVADDEGLAQHAIYGDPQLTFLTIDANDVSTNIVIVGNTFHNQTSTNLPLVKLANQSAGPSGLVYADNGHWNTATTVENGRSRDMLFTGNRWHNERALPTGISPLTVAYGPQSTVEINGNTFQWTPDTWAIESVGTNLITLANQIYSNLKEGPLETGDAVQFLANDGSVGSLTDRGVYYVNVIAEDVVSLYDTEANAIAGGATGLQSVTSITYGIVLPWLVRYEGSNYAIRIQYDIGGTVGGAVHVGINNNMIDWPRALWVGMSPDHWATDKTNYTAYFRRLQGPVEVTLSDNQFGRHVEFFGEVRHEQLGWNASLSFLDGNRMFDGRRAPNAGLTNVFMRKGSVWFDDDFTTSALDRWTANRNGWFQNSQGATAWTTATAYSEGDLVLSNGRTYACVVAGTSSTAPTGTGDSNGVIWDGTLTWVNLGSYYMPLTAIGSQIGFRSNAGTPFNVVTPRFSGEEIYDSTSGLWWKAKSVLATDWIPNSPMFNVETLSYSGTTVTVSGRKGAAQRSFLNATNDFTIGWTLYNNTSAGTIIVQPAATNITVTLPSYARSPSGRTMTIMGGTGNTNHTVIGWEVELIGGTNRISVNAVNYY
ncbi:MAG: right-handed parallel beta-helix repeat-containing protein [Limnohabitans sp.]